MDILPGFKLCRKRLHQYPIDSTQCPQCKKAAKQKWNKTNLEKKKLSDKKWRQKNSERLRQIQKRWNKKYPDRRSKINLRWQKENPEKANALTAKRRSRKNQAIAPWADLVLIRAIYEKAHQLTKNTGVPHEVDHIYPLQSKYMCGLHVETNLQILTRKQNRAKGNRTWPGQLDCQKD